jgi:hypothetical protein
VFVLNFTGVCAVLAEVTEAGVRFQVEAFLGGLQALLPMLEVGV